MANVFLSYARADADLASRFAQKIIQEGLTCFYDVNIPVGESWDEKIEREIGDARAVVVLWSNASRASRWVKREARNGLYRGILCPAVIEPCQIPLEFTDVQAAMLMERKFDSEHREWVRLTERIKMLCGSCNAKPEPASTISLTSEQLEAFTTVLIAAALVDGELSSDEKAAFFEIARLSPAFRMLSYFDLTSLSEKVYLQLKADFETTVNIATSTLPPDAGPGIFAHAVSIVLADRSVAPLEATFLDRLAGQLQVDRATASTILDVMQLRSSI